MKNHWHYKYVSINSQERTEVKVGLSARSCSAERPKAARAVSKAVLVGANTVS